MYPRYASLVIAAFAATLTACGSDTTTNVLPGAEPVVSAPDYAVTLADGTIQLTVGEVKAFTVSARVKKSRTVRWSSSNTMVATVSANGTVTAKTVGTALVTATASNGAVDKFSTAVVSGTTTATVATVAKVASVLVSVPATTMTLGAAQTATATARDSAGTVLTGRTVTWSVSAGTSLMVNASGVVTALAGGTESVVATIDGVQGAQAITVATVTSVAVSPKTGTALAPAQIRQFTTVATWSDQVTRPVSITYTATGGTISTSGLYTAGQLAGTFLVIANCACGRADTAAVSIVLPAQLTSLTISPKIATVNAGATQQFSAVANWSTGATTLPPITYSATGGVVSTTGLWTAPSTAGTYKVIVAHTGGTLKDTASVTVQVATTTAIGAAAPFFEDNFDNGLKNNAGGFIWGAGTAAQVTNGRAFSGNYALTFTYNAVAAGQDSFSEQRFNMGRYLSEVWIEYMLFVPDNFRHRAESPSNNKFLMLWRDTYSDAAGGTWRIGAEYSRGIDDMSSNLRFMSSRWDYNSLTNSGPWVSNPNPTPALLSSSGPMVRGTWNKIRFHVKAASSRSSSDGQADLWINNTRVLAVTDGRFHNFYDSPVDAVLRNGYLLGWANSGFTEQTTLFVDDVRFYQAAPNW